jgi:hypothetical protein
MPLVLGFLIRADKKEYICQKQMETHNIQLVFNDFIRAE